MWTQTADPSDETVNVGDVVAGRFEITRPIGRGGMGTVFEARHLASPEASQNLPPGATVALKILHAKHLANQEAVGRFLNEGRAAASVRGENSVRVIEVAQHQGRPIIVMELLNGADLSAVLRRGALEPSLAALFILQACEGMAEVHAQGMVHRDLKPSNLFLTNKPDGSPLVKVLDFGIAKSLVQDDEQLLVQTLTAVALGTPLYMSPEQIRSSGDVDSRADVWSLGTILYELLTGRPAFGGNTVSHITAQILERDPPPPSVVNPRLGAHFDAMIAKCLAKDPNQRFQTVAELARVLEPWAGARGVGTTARAQRWVDTRRSDPVTSAAFWNDGTVETKRAKTRLFSIALAGLLVVTTVLVGLAVSAYRSSKTPTGTVLALQPMLDTSLAARAARSGAAASATATPVIVPVSSATSTTSVSAPAVKTGRPGPIPSARPQKTSEAAPAPTVKAPPTGGGFDPFRDRN